MKWVRIPYQVEGRGNMHYPSLRQYSYETFDLIGLPRVEGSVPAEEVSLVRYQGEWPVTPLRGRIQISAGSMEIAMDFHAGRSGAKQDWVPYSLNGKFRVLEEDVDCGIDSRRLEALVERARL